MTTDDVWLQPVTNEIGTFLLPLINGIGNNLNNFTYKDSAMQAGLNMYPGEEWCNLVIPHAKWHVQTGIALTDFSYLSDEIYRIFNTYY